MKWNRIWGDEMLGIVSGAMTFVILVFTEIIPKTIGVVKAKKLTPFAAYFISAMVFLTYPFVLMAQFISGLLGGGKGNVTSREEMIAQAEIGANEGSIQQKESRVI